MKIKRYMVKSEPGIPGLPSVPISKYPLPTQLLMEQGALSSWPKQVKNLALVYDEGVDITYSLRNMSPARFREFSELLLLAAFEDLSRYTEPEYHYFFAKFIVRLNLNPKGRKMIHPVRTYTAARHTDIDVMVYGEKALGYFLEEEEKKPFLINKVEEILNIPDSPSPGPYVNKQRPYRVDYMVLCVRAGLTLKGFSEVVTK